MVLGINKWLNKNYPQNFILKKPYIGTIIFLAFCFAFVVMYKPLDLHESLFFNYEFTMMVYLSALSIPVFFLIKLLKNINYFSDPNDWTILKELISIIIIPFLMGIAIYFLGFLLESHSPRWNIPTFLDSCEHTFLIGIVPFMFFSAINYRHLYAMEIIRNFKQDIQVPSLETSEKIVRIASQLKKEELNIYPSHFVYAESDSNYVIFYLNENNQIQKKMIRNSISNIEQQLSSIPFIVRTHRAFIVNIKQVLSQKGNSSGYQLKLNGVDTIIPVSRQKTKDFDQLLKLYR